MYLNKVKPLECKPEDGIAKNMAEAGIYTNPKNPPKLGRNMAEIQLAIENRVRDRFK